MWAERLNKSEKLKTEQILQQLFSDIFKINIL